MADFTFIGSARAGADSGAISITHGLTIASGDLVVMYVNGNLGSGNPFLSADEDAGSAWVQCMSIQPHNAPYQTAVHGAWYRIADGSEPSAFTISEAGVSRYQVIVMQFRPVAGTVVLSNFKYGYDSSTSSTDIWPEPDGMVIPDDALCVVFGGKDTNNATPEDYTDADNSFIGEIGSSGNQATAGAYRIYTTGETFSGKVAIDTADGGDGIADYTYSANFVFNVIQSSTFPLVKNKKLSQSIGGANVTVDMPADITEGNTLILIVSTRASTINTTLSGWTLITNSGSSVVTDQVCWWRKAGASEAASVTVDIGDSSIHWSGAVYEISNAADPDVDPPEGSVTYIDSDDANPDPPNHTTSGAKDYLWLAIAMWRATVDHTAHPANYTCFTDFCEYNRYAKTVICQRELNATSENPGAFTLGQANDWSATTLAIHPAAAATYPYQIHKHKRGGMNVLLTR